MGNPSWGAGYHAGKDAGQAAGLVQGRTEGVIAGATAGLLLAGGALLIQKFKERSLRRAEVSARVVAEEAEHEADVSGEAGPGSDLLN